MGGVSRKALGSPVSVPFSWEDSRRCVGLVELATTREGSSIGSSAGGFTFLSLQVKVPMKFNGSSGVQVRMPSNLQDLAAYTSLKFYIQNPEPRSRQRRQDETEEGRFVLYLGSREVRQDGAGRRRAAGARVGDIHEGSHLDISPCPFTSLWGAQTGPGLEDGESCANDGAWPVQPWEHREASLGAPAGPKCQRVALSLPEFRPLETTWASCSRTTKCSGFTNWAMRSQPP